jgi:hypothetical protein
MDFSVILKICLKRFFLLRHLPIADWPMPSALAAALWLTYSTVSPVSMFVTSIALQRAALAAAIAASAASRLAGSCQFFFLDSLILARVASEC